MLSNGMVIFAKDVARVSDFYQQTLDLSVHESEKSHEVLRGRDLELVIHAIPAAHAAGITIAEPPVLRGETAIKPVFKVVDLEAVRTAVESTGGLLKPLKEAWKIRGALVLDGCDPEGNIIQFKQVENPE